LLFIPFFVGAEESADDVAMFERCLFDWHPGTGSREGAKARSIFQGETLSGR